MDHTADRPPITRARQASARPPTRPRRTRLIALLAPATMLAGLLGGGSIPAGAETNGPTSYVALGDSFTAGPLVPPQLVNPIGCLRSSRNYPHLVAAHSGQDEFRDVSCSGARTDHMFREHNVPGGPNPPQLDALDADTGLVTLGIGGNDIGFSNIIESCVSLWPFGSPCRDRFTAGGQDEITRRIQAAAPKVDEVLTNIAARSPNARVLVVGYPHIMPEGRGGCWPAMPVARDDVPYLRAKQNELNAMLADRATAHGAEFVDVDEAGTGRDSCSSSRTRWVEPLIPTNAAAPVHPNARGLAGVAEEVIATLG